MSRPRTIAVIGAGAAPEHVLGLAEAVGAAIARRGATLVCGGLGGVMEAACRGAREAGGHTIGILPGRDGAAANPHVEFAIATGLGEARNVVVATAADAVIALAGEAGTLSEIGFAQKLGRPIVALRAWSSIEGLEQASDPETAVETALRLVG